MGCPVENAATYDTVVALLLARITGIFRAQPSRFDLLVTDNSMPKLTGLELSRAVSAARPELPILLISGLPPSTEQLAQYGIREAIAKPCTMDALENALSRLIDATGK